MLNFLKREADKTNTLNGAVTYASTMSDCLDFFATAGALRNASEDEIVTRFVKAFAEKMFPRYAEAIRTLEVENVITPYTIRDEGERITNYSNATGGKPVMSQRTAVSRLGMVDDVDEEIKLMEQEETTNLFDEPTE